MDMARNIPTPDANSINSALVRALTNTFAVRAADHATQLTDPVNAYLSSSAQASAKTETLTQKIQKVQNVPWVC